jgi:ATP-binding cassette subfamily B protein
VSQENFIFATSIRDNVALAQNLTDDEIWHYLHLAGLAEDIRNFAQGLNTTLREWGVNLSGGQKQRLCLARALAQKPTVLLLDDCLSAVDSYTEKVILENLDRDLKSATLIWVAHRETTLQKCTRIINLDEQ